MTEARAKKIFEKYNPADGVVRCPNGRAKMRKPLDEYVQAAVNLYGIITRGEMAEIFNSQNQEQTTAEEIYTLLLPNVLKQTMYGFYKDYIVHYAILEDFDFVDYLEEEQKDKPCYIPPKEKFLMFQGEWYNGCEHWHNLLAFMCEAFSYKKNITQCFGEIKDYFASGNKIEGVFNILEEYGIELENNKQGNEFLNLIMNAKNNTRIWENKGHTPNEMMEIFSKKRPKEPVLHVPKKVGANQPCPCGSGKKYKRCCGSVQVSGAAQIAEDERKLFYETWYKLLNYVNKKLKVVDYQVEVRYPAEHDEIQLHHIRDRLWESPELISEFIASVGEQSQELSGQEIALLKSWESNHVKGIFILVNYQPEYAVLMCVEGETGKNIILYGVKGISSSVADSMGRKLPMLVETALLPFEDRIVYDSFMAVSMIEFDERTRRVFIDEYEIEKKERGIITKL